MEFIMDRKQKLAKVWCSHADQGDATQQEKLREFIADCRKKKIFVCIYESGGGDLWENTRELLVYNLNDPISRSKPSESRGVR